MKLILNIFATSYPAKCLVTGLAGGLLLLTISTGAIAQEVFRWVDKAGNVHYGDRLPPPAEVKNVQTKRLPDSVIEQDDVSFAVSTAMKNNPVTLYANSCGEACNSAKALLTKRGIPFSAKNPESDPAAAAALKEKVGALQVPTIVIGANSLMGFDESGWQSALSAAGYPRTNPTLRQGPTKAGPKTPLPATAAPSTPTTPATTAK